MQIPPQVGKTAEQLGIGQNDPRVLRLPEGLETVGKLWFMYGAVEKLVVSSSVRELGTNAFCRCRQLREIVFEPGSRLESIGNYCFIGCGLRELVLPRSLRAIAEAAFQSCRGLASVRFEEGSQICSVGFAAFYNTQLTWEEEKRLEALGKRM